jgi:mono/diheme cytochrome c family protein
MNKHRIGALIAPFFILSCMATEKLTEKPIENTAVVEVKVESKKTQAELIEQGRRLYISNCISCHNKDPNLKGALGPEMVDAPLEVMTSKIMTGVYPEKLPEGYIPKRKTKIMKAIPKLKEDIPAIYAWVHSMKPKKVDSTN